MKLHPKFFYYAALGFLPPLIERLSSLDAATLSAMIWPQWTVMVLMPVYSMLLGLKALTSEPPPPPVQPIVPNTTAQTDTNG